MSKSQLSPISLRERIEILDVLRGLAVCGILVGNMQWFSGISDTDQLAMAEVFQLRSNGVDLATAHVSPANELAAQASAIRS